MSEEEPDFRAVVCSVDIPTTQRTIDRLLRPMLERKREQALRSLWDSMRDFLESLKTDGK